MKLQLATIAMASALAVSANATTTDWGVHDTLELAAALTPIGGFDDSYLFQLPDTMNLFNTTVTNNLTGVLGLGGGVVALFKEAGAVDTAVGSFAFSDLTGSISHAFGTMNAGDYYYRVTGTGTGSEGGLYILSSTVTAVPEPQTYLLMLAGLGAMGFISRRRRSD